jgi:predicted DNA-binding transcriptional regulator YafY
LKLERLISILVVLLRKQRVQAKELAEMFDVSVRTILRDIDSINVAGIPIITYQGVNGGIGIAEGYRLDRSILSSDDMAAILTALKGVAGTIPDSRNEILIEKFKSILSSSQLETLDSKTNRLIIDLSPWGEDRPLKEKLTTIRRAIEGTNIIEFKYTDSKGNISNRKVEPYSLVLKGQKWYLYTWCMMRQGFRLFKLSRIGDLKVLEASYKPRPISLEQLPWDAQWNNTENMIELELVFERNMAGAAIEWFGEDLVRADDGRILARVMLPENNWLYGFILSFGTGVEVISPLHIRTIITNLAEGIYKKYLPKT